MFSQALRVSAQLLLFRGNPADFPYSLAVTRMSAIAAFASAVLLMSPALPLAMAIATGLGGVAGLAFFTRQLLKANQLENRFLQLFGAQALVGALFALAMVPPFAAMAPAMLAVMKNPELLQQMAEGQGALAVPQWAALLADVLFFWNLAVSVRINRLGAELKMPISWLVTIGGLFVLMAFVTLSQVVALVFTGAPAAGGH